VLSDPVYFLMLVVIAATVLWMWLDGEADHRDE
jgi:hypothetical protein